MPLSPEMIRNVAVVGHRGTGKTSLCEALLYQSGAVTRLGTIADGTTVSDHDEDEKRRSMSISAAVMHAEHREHRINLIDAPGDPSFIADAVEALRVVEGALVVVSGVLGVEVMTSRMWARADDLGIPRVVVVNMLDRERADFGTVMDALQSQLSGKCVAISIPIGHDTDFRGVIDVLHMCVYDDPGRAGDPSPIPDELAAEAQAWRDKLMDFVAMASDDLMERYLEGEEIGLDELRQAFHDLVEAREIFPVACASASKNIGTRALLDLIVEGLPSPLEEPGLRAHDADGSEVRVGAGTDGTAALCFKTVGDAHVGRVNLVRVFSGHLGSDSQLLNVRTQHRERIGQLLDVQGRDHKLVPQLGPGEIGAVPKLKDVMTGDLLSDRALTADAADLPEPVVAVAVDPKAKGDEDKMATALRRLGEEDPTLRIARDERTGELIVSGLSQMHVDVTVERVRRRFGVEMITHPPRVPYLEAIRSRARAHARYKKQTGGRGQFGDCHIEVEPLAQHEGYEFIDKIVGGVIPQGFRPAVDKGIQEAMAHGDLAGYPVVGVRVTLVDGSYHNVDSSEMAFKIAGSMAFKQAYHDAQPVLLEPIMAVEVSVPEESVGDVIGDLNSRRGRPLGMEPNGPITTIRAEVPMAEMLTYAPDLTSKTGGRGDYHMTLSRYEEVPAHVAQRVIDDAAKEREAVKA